MATAPNRRTCVDISAKSIEPRRRLVSSRMRSCITWPSISERPFPEHLHVRQYRDLSRSRNFQSAQRLSDPGGLHQLSLRGANLAEISSSLLFPEVSHSLRSGIVHTRVGSRVWVRALGATIARMYARIRVCVCEVRVCANLVQVYIYPRCESSNELHYMRPARCELFRWSNLVLHHVWSKEKMDEASFSKLITDWLF